MAAMLPGFFFCLFNFHFGICGRNQVYKWNIKCCFHENCSIIILCHGALRDQVLRSTLANWSMIIHDEDGYHKASMVKLGSHTRLLSSITQGGMCVFVCVCSIGREPISTVYEIRQRNSRFVPSGRVGSEECDRSSLQCWWKKGTLVKQKNNP